MNAELNAQGLSHAPGVVEDLSRRVQRTEAGAGARVIGLDHHADLRFTEECELSRRRLREAEHDWSGRASCFQEHELNARRELQRLGQFGPVVMATEQQLEAECRGLGAAPGE